MPTLDWIGKSSVRHHHREVPYRLLHCDTKRSAGDPDAGNLIVQGDNLNALKALLPYYAGKVKCIYIDPPYNTGNEGWVYNDNVNAPEIKDWLKKVVGKEGEDLSRHDKWLCMMYPRLKLLREFLREDGVVFASIDNNAADYLRILLDELFDRSNFIGTIVWKNAADNNPTQIVPEHEYVICYANNRSRTNPVWKSSSLAVQQKLDEVGRQFIADFSDQDDRQKAYTAWYRDEKSVLWPFQDYKFIDDDGIYTGMRAVHNPGKEGYRYDVIHPETGKPCKEPLMGYRFPEETMNGLLKEGRILFGKDHTKLIELKVYAKDYRAKLSSVFELDGRRGTNEIKSLFPESKRAFNFPKPTALIEELLAFTTDPDSLILDSFAGSGTTMHAVMQLNREDGGNRRCIMVEMEEKIATEVTSERIRRVMDQDAARDDEGFRYCTLGDPLFAADGTIREKVKYKDLAHHIYFTETGLPLPPGTKPKSDKTPLLGTDGERTIYLLYNGIMGDKSINGGNVLTRQTLAACGAEQADGLRVIYGEGCRLSPATLRRLNITFKQLPYDVKVS